MGDHALQSELGGTFLSDRYADESPTVMRHEVDRLGCDLGGCHDEIALILSIFIIGDDDHPALAYFLDDLVYGIEMITGQRTTDRCIGRFFPLGG